MAKLSDGVVGSKLIEYFKANHGSLPITADVIDDSANIKDQKCYRITFANGDVSDWLVTFEPGVRGIYILSAECFNEVI